MSLGGWLEAHGLRVSYVDCLDRFHPNAPPVDPLKRHGRGPYRKTPIPKPSGLAEVPRNFSRYGILPEWFESDLMRLDAPDLILVTSMMTYWYTGVKETITMLRGVFGDTPIVLGGIYASLCREHAHHQMPVDDIISGPGEPVLPDLLHRHTGLRLNPKFSAYDPDSWPFPAFHLQRTINFIPLLTTRGCPYACTYCASSFLNEKWWRRKPEGVVEEILYWHAEHRVRDFVLYDDALLTDARHHIVPILEAVIRRGITVRFHTPNAVHLREITPRVAQLMFDAGFKTLRLGLETTAFETRNRMDRKVTEGEFTAAVQYLMHAGFRTDQVGAYLLAGLPGQTPEAVEASIAMVKTTGITPVIAHYTPIPHTAMWPEAVAASPYDLENEPLFTNNALFPCRREGFSWDTLARFKQLIAG